MALDFQLPVKMDHLQSGGWTFRRFNTEIYGDGFAGFRHLVPLSQTGFLFTQVLNVSGAYRFDGGDGRTPLRVMGDASGGEAHLYQRFQLPLDWGSWMTNPFEISTYRSSDLVLTMDATWIGPTGAQDATFVAVDVKPSVSGTWERFAVAAPTGAYVRGDFATLQIGMTFDAASGSDFAEIADWSLAYLSGRGNVR